MLLMPKHQLSILTKRFAKEMPRYVYTSKTGHIYKHCFRGNEAVDWFLKNTSAKTRQEGVFLGDLIMHRKIFGAIEKGNYGFKDKPVIFQIRDINKEGKCFVTSDSISLYYRIWKPPTKEHVKGCIIFVHGLGEHSGRYVHFVEKWIKLGFSVLSYDMRGHGHSSGKRGHFTSHHQLIEDLNSMINVLLNKKKYRSLPFFLYARGLGALVVLHMCAQKPDLRFIRGVIACAPLIKFSKEAQKELKRQVFKHITPKQAIYFNVYNLISKDSNNVQSYKEDTLCHGYITASAKSAIIEAGKKLLSQAKQITYPTIIIHGDADKYASLLASVDLVETLGSKDKTIKVWPSLYHDIEHEPEKDDVFNVVVDWVNKRLV
eukprot:TRINITY_DN848_c0_g1_i1.p1 TRINITY_DN848_c0_g1~~TRINITY_DN848_c0_g1_i1.p1  ORF type:complete len:374 (-),score=34.53 TRINITY_DN848_c0_g1_i1:4-1125(-)